MEENQDFRYTLDMESERSFLCQFRNLPENKVYRPVEVIVFSSVSVWDKSSSFSQIRQKCKNEN